MGQMGGGSGQSQNATNAILASCSGNREGRKGARLGICKLRLGAWRLAGVWIQPCPSAENHDCQSQLLSQHAADAGRGSRHWGSGGTACCCSFLSALIPPLRLLGDWGTLALTGHIDSPRGPSSDREGTTREGRRSRGSMASASGSSSAHPSCRRDISV